MKLEKIVNSGKNILKTSLLVGALSLPSMKNAYADTQKASYFGRLGVAIKSYSGQVRKIKDIPLEIRDIPIHPDDEYKTSEEDAGPIKKDSVYLSSMLSFVNIENGVHFPLSKKLGLRSGLQVEVMVPFDFSEGYEIRDSMHERDYLFMPGSSERGVGRALTYYSAEEFYLKPGNRYFRPTLFAEMVLERERDEDGVKRDVLLGYSFNQTGILLENGWDRYNKLERRNVYPVARVNEHKVYLKMDGKIDDATYLDLLIGLSMRQGLNRTNLGKTLRIDQKEIGWFAGASFGWNIE